MDPILVVDSLWNRLMKMDRPVLLIAMDLVDVVLEVQPLEEGQTWQQIKQQCAPNFRVKACLSPQQNQEEVKNRMADQVVVLGPQAIEQGVLVKTDLGSVQKQMQRLYGLTCDIRVSMQKGAQLTMDQLKQIINIDFGRTTNNLLMLPGQCTMYQDHKQKKGNVKQNDSAQDMIEEFKKAKEDQSQDNATRQRQYELSHPTLVHVDLFIKQNEITLNLEGEVVHLAVQSIILFQDMNEYQAKWYQLIESIYADLLFMYSHSHSTLLLYDHGHFLIRKIDCNKPDLLDLYCRRQMKQQSESITKKPMNVHRLLAAKPQIEFTRSMVWRDYLYYHYMQDGYDDKGWGCAYRSMMTVISSLLLNNLTKHHHKSITHKLEMIPTHKRIQEILVQIEDKHKSFIGSQEWIGALEVCYTIKHLLDVDCRIVFVQNGSQVIDHALEFSKHFEQGGCPIMFGGGQYAYTLVGIEYEPSTGHCMFCILDPHYTASDQPKTMIEKHALFWRDHSFFSASHFYNFCVPVPC